MGRHKKMSAAAAPLDERGPERVNEGPAPLAAASRVRRLTMTTLGTEERIARYERLRQLSIRTPESPLRAAAVERAALVWAHTPETTDVVDQKSVRIVMRFFYIEALIHQSVDEERALTRANVDRYLSEENSFSLHSQRIYRTVLYAAGRVLYPREFPAPQAVLAPRKKRTPAAIPGLAAEFYELVPVLPPGLRLRLLLILDLVTGAGLRAQEVRVITGGDVSARRIGLGHEVTVVQVRHRGIVDRVVPIIDARRGQRILDRAREVGPDQPLMPAGTRERTVERNAVNRVSEQLKRLGYPGVDVAALRSRWILDLASTPGIPTAALMRMAGVGDLQVLADQKELLPDYSPEELAELLIQASDEGEAA